MTAGKGGPIVLQDFTLIDHIAHFDRERIPERECSACNKQSLATVERGREREGKGERENEKGRERERFSYSFFS